MRLYSVEVLIRAKQQIIVSAEDEDFAMDKAQDRIDLKEAVIDDIDMEIEDVTEIYGGLTNTRSRPHSGGRFETEPGSAWRIGERRCRTSS